MNLFCSIPVLFLTCSVQYLFCTIPVLFYIQPSMYTRQFCGCLSVSWSPSVLATPESLHLYRRGSSTLIKLGQPSAPSPTVFSATESEEHQCHVVQCQQSPNPWVQEASSIPLDSKIFSLLNTHKLYLWFHCTLYVICTAPHLTLCVIKVWITLVYSLQSILVYIDTPEVCCNPLDSEPCDIETYCLMMIVMTKPQPKKSNSKFFLLLYLLMQFLNAFSAKKLQVESF